MPRGPRQKSSECMYHVMGRSISEVDLFPSDEDKDHFLKLLKLRKEKYCCRIYAYCLMTNHYHIYINPQEFDISDLMRSLNTAYGVYYNRKYGRHGCLFQGRFASEIIDNDNYSLTLSAYIHNNSKDLPGYCGLEETYRYSSYGLYTGYRKDTEGIVDTGFILQMFSNDPALAREKYRCFSLSMKDTGIVKEVDDRIMRDYTNNQYYSEKEIITRYKEPEELMKKITEGLGLKHPERLKAKYIKEASKDRAFTSYVLRVLCGFSYKQICHFIGNMSMSGITRLVILPYKRLWVSKVGGLFGLFSL